MAYYTSSNKAAVATTLPEAPSAHMTATSVWPLFSNVSFQMWLFSTVFLPMSAHMTATSVSCYVWSHLVWLFQCDFSPLFQCVTYGCHLGLATLTFLHCVFSNVWLILPPRFLEASFLQIFLRVSFTFLPLWDCNIFLYCNILDPMLQHFFNICGISFAKLDVMIWACVQVCGQVPQPTTNYWGTWPVGWVEEVCRLVARFPN